MTNDYFQMAKAIDDNYMVYRDGDYINFLYPYPPKNSNILLQEQNDYLIVWAIDYREKSYSDVLKTIYTLSNVDVIVPFLETEEEHDAVLALGGDAISFDAEGCEDYSRKFGSFIIRK